MVIRSLAAVCVALAMAQALAAEWQGFSFEYQISGDRSIAPFQVFDDGTATFLQFRDPAKVPAIFVRDAEGSRLVSPQPQGNYLRIAGLVQRLELVSERKTAAVVSLRKHPLPAPGGLPQRAILAAEPDGAAAARRPQAPQPAIGYGPAVRATASAPAPLYAQTAVRTEPPAAASTPPADAVEEDLAEVRRQLEQLRQVLDAVARRLPRAGASRAVPPQDASDPVGAGASPRLHRAHAEPAGHPQTPGGAADLAALSDTRGRGDGSSHASVHAAAGRGAGEGAAPAAAIPSGETTRILVFEVEPGQRLSEAVRRFVSSHRLELDWDTGGADYEIRYGFRVLGGTVDEVLFGVLSPFRLSAVTRRGNNVVAVSRAA